MSRFLSVAFALLIALSSFTPALAQTSSSTAPVSGEPSETQNSPLTCFDYYHFGSVTADLQSTVAQTVPGSTLSFSGDLKNENPYPLLEGTLYVKIFRRDDAVFAAGDGNVLVDQFVVKDSIILPAHGVMPMTYEWKVPANAEGGEYYAAYFFTTQKRYNLMGLSFTEDVVGNQAPFSVASSETAEKPVTLSKIDTTVNNRNHNFAAFPLRFNAGETVVVETTITNPTSIQKTVPLQWNQYAWDSMNEKNLRYTKTEIVTLAANETKKIQYEVQPQREAVVYVIATTQDFEAKSILNIRFARDGIEETRINFPSLTSFPLEKGKESTLFACAHATTLAVVPDNILTLRLTGRDGEVIHEYTYTGDIRAKMSGFGESFTPEKNINYVTLTATLERNGVIVEQVEQVYDCNAIDPGTCLPEESAPFSLFDFFKTLPMTLLLLFGALIFAASLLYIYIKRKRVHIDGGPTMSTPLAAITFLFILPTLFLAAPHIGEASAKTVTWDKWELSSQQSIFTNNIFSVCPTGAGGVCYPVLSDAHIEVSYGASVVNSVNGNAAISDGSSVPVGTCLDFVHQAHRNSDIFWLGSPLSSGIQITYDGGNLVDYNVFDSPNGHWVNNALAPSTKYMAQDSLGSYSNYSLAIERFASLSIAPPSKRLDFTGTTAGLSDMGNNRYCVTSPGTISAKFIFESTYGKYYYGETPWAGLFSFVAENTLHPVYLGGYTINGYVGSLYQLSVPAQTINFNFTATGATNAAPATPTITGPTTGAINTGYNFSVVSTDGDGDTLRYGITDAACTVVTEWLPGSGYVNSGTSQTKSGVSWGSVGTYTLYVLAEDSKSGRSACAAHTITIAAAPPASANLTINGSDGPLTVVKNSALTLAWNSTNAATCSLYGNGLLGGSVALNSNTSATITASDTYVLTCGTAIDQVQVTVTNQPPNAPTITHPTGSVTFGTNTTFTVLGSDPDNDSVFYELDWNNDGSTDATTMTVPSGQSQPATRSFSAVGGQTFQARTIDIAGAISGWTQHTITVSSPPAATVTLEARINNGNWSTADQTVNPADTIVLRWTGTNSTGCSATAGSGFAASGNSGSDPVNTPAPAATDIFTINCSGPSGSGTDSITIATSQKPNFNQPNILFTPSAGFNPTTGEYDSVRVDFSTTNDGGSNTLVNANYEFQFDRGNNGYDFETHGAIGLLNVNQTFSDYEVVPGPIVFGNSLVRVHVDYQDFVDEVDDSLADNERILPVTLPPPNPNIEISADRLLVRSGEKITLTWNTKAAYLTSCSVTGPSIGAIPVGPSVTGAITGTIPSGIINAKSVFTLSCVVAGTTFTDTVTIESQGVIEET